MIKIIKNGYDKTYITDCWQCQTTFTYQREDTFIFLEVRKVHCPVCKTNCTVNFIEYDTGNDNNDEEDEVH